MTLSGSSGRASEMGQSSSWVSKEEAREVKRRGTSDHMWFHQENYE